MSATTAYAPPLADAPRSRGGRSARALFVRLAALLAIGALPVAFSAWIDPAEFVTRRTQEAAIARALASGQMVTNYANFDDRAIAKSLVALTQERPDVLGLGSSRLQMLPASTFAGERFVNGAVQAAQFDDLVGVYALYDTPALRPKRVLLNVDPWTPSVHDGTGWRVLADERASLLRRIGVPVSPLRDRVAMAAHLFKLLAGPEYFRLAVFSFRHYGTHGIRWEVTPRAQNKEKTKLPNGSIVWADLPPDNSIAVAKRFAAEGLLAASHFEHLAARAPGRADALEKFVRYMRAEGVEVTVLLVPFPPEVYDAFPKLRGGTPMEIESELRAMARRTGAGVVGSYDPRRLGVGTLDFFDEDHLRPGALARVVRGTLGTSRTY